MSKKEESSFGMAFGRFASTGEFFLGQHILVPLRLEFHRFADVFVGDFENLILRKPEKYSSWK